MMGFCDEVKAGLGGVMCVCLWSGEGEGRGGARRAGARVGSSRESVMRGALMAHVMC